MADDALDLSQLLAGSDPVATDPAWLGTLSRALDDAPDPEHARKLAVSVLEATPRPDLLRIANSHPDVLTHVVVALCGVAPFFATHLTRNPGWLPALVEDDLSRPRSPKNLEAGLDRVFDRHPDHDPAELLRRFKYFELARLTIRDTRDEWVSLEQSRITLNAISELADVLLDRAMRIARDRVSSQMAPPTFVDPDGRRRAIRFCALGLGKLGASELNYSSDVDLIYVSESLSEAEAGTREGSEPNVYLTKLAIEFGKIVSATSVAGFLYRVDLDLRPEGAQGNLVVTSAALQQYYESWADTWETTAFMKARPVAGDLEFGWQTIRAVSPSIYHSAMKYRSVDGIRSLKEKIASVRGGDSDSFDVKIDPGGIRDVEFITQVQQLLHGARIPQIRNRSTLESIIRLSQVGLLEHAVAKELVRVYLFLRRVENRLQMEAERQTHKLPKTEMGLRRLSRAMNYLGDDGIERFGDDVAASRQFLKNLLEVSFVEGNREHIQELFARGLPSVSASISGKRMLDEMAEHFSRQIDAAPDAERALNNLDRFVQGMGQRRFYFELLLDRPELVGRLTSLFAASNYLSGYLARHPRLIEPLFNYPDRLLLDRDQLSSDFREVMDASLESLGDSLESQLDALRLFHHRQIVNVGLLDLDGRCTRPEIDRALTDIAEVCIDEALEISRSQLAERPAGVPEAARSGAFLVVGMGKLASGELSYGSDLDVIFLYRASGDAGPANMEAQDYFIRLAQRFISALHTPTAQGNCYEVDARLRPSGNQGMLVTSMQSYEKYHAESAQVWERQALLRARAVAGNPELAETFERQRLEILRSPLPEGVADEIHRVRIRMEEELAQETSRRRDLKTGRGGVLDVENAVQYLQLLHGGKHPELHAVDRLENQLERLHELGLVDEASTRVLVEGWTFLQRLSSRLRIVENRSISELDVERSDLDTLALQLGYPPTGRDGGPSRALLRDYDRHTEAVRSAYLKLIQA